MLLGRSIGLALIVVWWDYARVEHAVNQSALLLVVGTMTLQEVVN